MLIFPSADPIHTVTIRPNPNYLCQQRRLQSRRPAFKEYSEYCTDLYITFSWYLYLLYSSQRCAIIPARDVSAERGRPVLRGMSRFYRSVTPNLFTNVAIPYCARTFGHSVLSPTLDWSILLRIPKYFNPLRRWLPTIQPIIYIRESTLRTYFPFSTIVLTSYISVSSTWLGRHHQRSISNARSPTEQPPSLCIRTDVTLRWLCARIVIRVWPPRSSTPLWGQSVSHVLWVPCLPAQAGDQSADQVIPASP